MPHKTLEDVERLLAETLVGLPPGRRLVEDVHQRLRQARPLEVSLPRQVALWEHPAFLGGIALGLMAGFTLLGLWLWRRHREASP